MQSHSDHGDTAAGGRCFNIRRMTWRDIPAVWNIDHAAFGADAWSQEFFWAQLAVPGNHFWVATAADTHSRYAAGHVCGYAGLAVSGPQGDVLTIATAAQVRGQGLGDNLLSTLEDHAKNRGVTALYLDVASTNTVATKLYEKHGYAVLGLRPGYYANADALIMRKLL